MRIERSDFGLTPAGETVDLWRFGTPGGFDVEMVSYGARIRSVDVPDRAGRVGDVALGLADLPAYLADRYYLGATVGRYAGRIRGAELVLDGAEYDLDVNELGNTLHGGTTGFSERVWAAEPVEEGERVGVRFHLVSAHLDMGFPGRLAVSATYTVGSAPGGAPDLRIDYAASCDRTTALNLTNHVYLNLAGAGHGDVEDHVLHVAADTFTEQNADATLTGRVLDVTGTALDLRRPTVLRAALGSGDAVLADPGGFDHNLVLTEHAPDTVVAELSEPTSGRAIRIRTDQPGLQLWTANRIPELAGKHGQVYGPRSAVCLETQHFADSPRFPAFPSTVLRPGDRFGSTTTYEFATV